MFIAGSFDRDFRTILDDHNMIFFDKLGKIRQHVYK
jgi:hypothetical protein